MESLPLRSKLKVPPQCTGTVHRPLISLLLTLRFHPVPIWYLALQTVIPVRVGGLYIQAYALRLYTSSCTTGFCTVKQWLIVLIVQ